MEADILGLDKTKLSLASEIKGREETLGRLDELGLSDEELLRLKAFVARMAKGAGATADEIKNRLFLALALFSDIPVLRTRKRKRLRR